MFLEHFYYIIFIVDTNLVRYLHKNTHKYTTIGEEGSSVRFINLFFKIKHFLYNLNACLMHK